MKWLSFTGLVLDIIGAVMLAWGTLRRLSTWFRSQGFGQYSYERKHATWYQWIAVQVSRRLFGSSDVTKANPESMLEEIGSIFWAVVLLVIGFSFQLLGVIFSLL